MPERVVSSYIQPSDIMPTLAELAGLQLDPPDPIHGTSFAPQLRGQETMTQHDFVVSSTFLRAQNGAIASTSVTPVVYTDQWIYAPINADGRVGLFDRQADPMAETNVAAGHETVAREMQEMMHDYMDQLGAPPEAMTAVQPLSL